MSKLTDENVFDGLDDAVAVLSKWGHEVSGGVGTGLGYPNASYDPRSDQSRGSGGAVTIELSPDAQLAEIAVVALRQKYPATARALIDHFVYGERIARVRFSIQHRCQVSPERALNAIRFGACYVAEAVNLVTTPHR